MVQLVYQSVYCILVLLLYLRTANANMILVDDFKEKI